MSQLASLYLYPVKSCASLAVESAEVRPRGLRFDRRWLAVDRDGGFLTGRQHPRLTRLRAEPHARGLRLSADGMPALDVPLPAADAERVAARVWKSEIDAAACGAEVDRWLSEFVAQPARLVHMDARAHRAVSSSRAADGDVVGFADAFPLLLLSQTAHDALNARLQDPLPITRFRPNLVVDGVDAHAEDRWRRIRIGSVEFDVAKPCVRCVLTTVDPARGERDPSGEPLRTLLGYRRGPDGVTFGQYLLPRGRGLLRRGDRLVVLDQ